MQYATCKVHKNQRWDMSHNLSYYNSMPLKHTIEETKQLAGKKKGNCYCVNPPIDRDRFGSCYTGRTFNASVVDVLTDNILDELEWVKIDDPSKRRCEEKGKYLDFSSI